MLPQFGSFYSSLAPHLGWAQQLLPFSCQKKMSLRHSIHSLAGQPRLEQVLQSLSKCLVSLWYSLILHDLRWSSMMCYSRANSANLHQLYVEPNDAKSKPPWKRPKDRAWATWQTFKWFYTNTSGNIPRPLWCLRWARRRGDVFAPATLRFRSEMQRNMRRINSVLVSSGLLLSRTTRRCMVPQSTHKCYSHWNLCRILLHRRTQANQLVRSHCWVPFLIREVPSWFPAVTNK